MVANAGLFSTLREFIKYSLAGALGVRWLLALVVLVFCLPLIAFRHEDLGNNGYFPDDMFYYFKTALNVWRYGYPTFDGVTFTNGFHPLWMVLLIILATPFALLGMADVFPYAALGLNVALVIVAAQLLYTVVSKIVDLPLLAFAVVLVATTAGIHVCLLNGMETACVLVSGLLLAIYVYGVLRNELKWHPVLLGGLTAILFLSRLDSAFLLILLFPFLARRLGWKRLARGGVCALVIIAPYLAFNTIGFGHAVPISGRVKAYWTTLRELRADGRDNRSMSEQIDSNLFDDRMEHISRFWDAKLQQPILQTLSGGTYAWGVKEWPRLQEVIGLILGLLLLVQLVLAVTIRRRGRARMFLLEFAVCCVGYLLMGLVYYAFYSVTLYPRHCGLWLPALSVILTLALLDLVRRPAMLGRLVAVGLLIALTVQHVDQVQSIRVFATGDNTYGRLYQQPSEWLRQNTKEDALVAGWSVGQLGMFSDRRVINLEGIISDEEVFGASREMTVPAYLLHHEVDYVVQHFQDWFFDLGVMEPQKWERADVIWPLRFRPIVDHSEAYQEAVRFAGKKSTLHILEVDHEKIRERLEEHRRRRERLSELAVIVPAETYAAGQDIRWTRHIPHTRDFALSGDSVTYSFESVPDPDHAIYGRFYCYPETQAEIIAECAGRRHEVRLRVSKEWNIVKLGHIDRSDRKLVLQLGSSEHCFVDEIYLVPSVSIDAFEHQFAHGSPRR